MIVALIVAVNWRNTSMVADIVVIVVNATDDSD